MYGALGPLVPTYEQCFVQDAQDALILVQAVVDKRLVAVERRPQDQERGDLIKSGNIFIFDERRGHIQRWTDGISWSPSRILGEFLIYRERKQSQRSSGGSNSFSKKGSGNSGHSPETKVVGSGSSGIGISKKPAPSRHRHSLSLERSQSILMSNSSSSGYSGYMLGHSGDQTFTAQHMPSHAMRSQSAEYNLYGSLTSNEQYKENGLIKKTISIPYKSSSYRLVSYYSPDDVEDKRLRIPSQDPKFADLRIQPELAETKNVKISLSLGPHEMGQHTMYMRPMSAGQMAQYHLTNNRQYSLGRRIDLGLGPGEYDSGYSQEPDGRVYSSSPSGGFDLGQNRGVHPIRGRVMSDVGAPRRTYGASESNGNFTHSTMDPAIDRNNFMELSMYNQPSDYEQELYSGYSPRQVHHQASNLNNNNRGPLSPTQLSHGSPMNKFQQQQMNSSPQQISNSLASSHSRNSSQSHSGQWNGYTGDSYHQEPAISGGMFPREPDLASPPTRNGQRTSGVSSNYDVLSQETFNNSDLVTEKQSPYIKPSPTELSPLTAEEVANVHPDIFASVSPGADNAGQDDSNVNSGGISASVIAGESDSYEPLYGTNDSPNETPLSEMPILSKEDYGNGLSISGSRHNSRHDSHRLSSQQQHIYMPATTTAPYNMHHF